MDLGANAHDTTVWLSGVGKNYLSVPGVALVLGIGSILWLLAGRSLRGILLLLWLLVPLLLTVASLAVAGPGRLFSKDGHEGRVLLHFSRKNAFTALDLFGLICFAIAIAMVLALIWVRYSQTRTERWRRRSLAIPDQDAHLS